MVGGNCVQDEVENWRRAFASPPAWWKRPLHHAQTLRVGNLFRRCGEQHYTRAESLGKFNAHMPEAAESDNSYVLTFANIPVAQGRIGGDARTEQRRRSREVELVRTRSTNFSLTTMLSEYPP